MNILVTGGAGYVGSHAVHLLRQTEHTPIVLDNLVAGHRAAVPDCELVVGSIDDEELLAKVLEHYRIDCVMHFAAYAYVGESVTDPARYYENNVAGTIRLLAALRKAGVDRFVFSSSCATYGIPERVPIEEEQPQQPVNPYGFTKLAIEHALRDYSAAYGLRCAVLRYFNAAGSSVDGELGEDHRPETHLIPLVLQTALGKRDAVKIFGCDYATPDGTCIRDYVHVDDLARAHVLALQMLDDQDWLAVNLGTGRGVSVAEIVAACRRITGREIPTIQCDRRSGDPPELVASCAQARNVLGWQAQGSDLDTIVETAWRWMQQHPDGYPE